MIVLCLWLCVASTARGEGAGAAIGQALQGVAAILAAGAPIAVAAAQAKADVKIAQINSEAQITMTQITADTTKYLSDATKDIALNQTYTAGEIAKMNNEGVTERLGMQLAELRAARQDAYQAQREARQMQWQYDQQRIALAQKQAADNLQLAKMTLNMQLTQAGLSQGFSNSVNSGDRLTVTRRGQQRPPSSNAIASAGGAAGAATDPAASAAGTAGSSNFDPGKAIAKTAGLSIARGNARGTARGAAAARGAAPGKTPNALAIAAAASAPRTASSARLLAAVSPGAVTGGKIGFTASGNPVSVASRTVTGPPRAIGIGNVGAGIQDMLLTNKFSRGSTRAIRQRLTLDARTAARAVEASDFARFRGALTEGAPRRKPASFAAASPLPPASDGTPGTGPGLPEISSTGTHAGE